MEDTILDLQDKITILEKKIEILEKKENKRRALFYIKLLIKIIVILAVVFGLWYGYNYISKELPNIMEEKIKELNPIGKN